MSTDQKPLFIPIILGTVRRGRASESVAKFVLAELGKRQGVETELVDIRDIEQNDFRVVVHKIV